MIIEQAKAVLRIEAESILGLMDRIGPEFEKCVNLILQSRGRVVLTGIGKSGLIGRKIAATLNSTGTPALFLHPAEAIHGDLGTVTREDIVLALSNSGHTAEINAILPILKRMGARIIAFTGHPDSPIARHCDAIIDVSVEREACPMGLAPTASTTAALAMGDALAVALIGCRRFNREDFRRFHPGGSLGERLAVKIREMMRTGRRVPVVPFGTPVAEAIREMDAKGLGVTLVADSQNRLAGIVTDGDLRRLLAQGKPFLEGKVEEIMTASPKTVDENQTAAEALALMELSAITHLVAVDSLSRIRGLVHLHDLLGREEFRLNGSVGAGPDR